MLLSLIAGAGMLVSASFSSLIDEQGPTAIILPTSYDGAAPTKSELSGSERSLLSMLEMTYPEADILLLPVLRAVRAYQDNDKLCIVGTDRPLAKNEAVSRPLWTSVFKAYALKETDGPIKTLGQLVGGQNFHEGKFPKENIVEGQSNEDLLAKLKHGRVDAIVMGPRAEEFGFVEKHGLRVVDGIEAKLDVRLRCRDTSSGRYVIGSINGFIERHVAARQDRTSRSIE